MRVTGAEVPGLSGVWLVPGPGLPDRATQHVIFSISGSKINPPNEGVENVDRTQLTNNSLQIIYKSALIVVVF